jgi:hypothetical protein
MERGTVLIYQRRGHFQRQFLAIASLIGLRPAHNGWFFPPSCCKNGRAGALAKAVFLAGKEGLA